MKISDVIVKVISDSRKGEETIEAELRVGDILVSASVPSGKSRGAHEAFALEPKTAILKFEEIKPQILSASADGRLESQEQFDNFLISLDGTPNKENLGGNLILSLSLAFARLQAKSEGIELYQYIGGIIDTKYKIQDTCPRFIFNMINGGAHSGCKEWSLGFQEFQLIPETKDVGIALAMGKEFCRKLKEFLDNKFGEENIFIGDEAGFSACFKSNEEPLEILADLISKYNYPFRIGLDAAATQFYKNGKYVFDGKEYFPEELKDYYLRLAEAYNILSIEDPFYEEDFGMFAALTKSASALVITDDLTTTNPERLKEAIGKKSGGAILVKPNQIGTLTETLNVVRLAYENNWQVVVSHRSGETMDDFIADLAVGVNAWGFKAGAPAAPERLAKYHRIIQIEAGRCL